jgi:hypothetical protein
MATTIQQGFQRLKGNLEITGLQSSTVSTRQQSVREAVEAELTVLDSFLTGSYSRSTMISPLSEADVDIFFVLDPKYFHNYNGQNGGQAGLLDLVKRALLRTYTKTPKISRSGQAVTITFTDFQVDVVPGFHRQGGGFLIPNSATQSWLSTDPKKHVEIMATANRAHDGDLVPLVKMIKGWNQSNGGHFRSFHLEVLALAALDKITITDFPSGARYFFDKARTLVTQKNSDPAGYGDDVGSYIDSQTKIDEAVTRFQRAYERTLKAEELDKNGKVADATEKWRIIFNDYFPAYG